MPDNKDISDAHGEGKTAETPLKLDPPETVATPSASDPKSDVGNAVERAVDAWWARVRSMPAIARNTAAHNLLQRELPGLKETLEREFGK